MADNEQVQVVTPEEIQKEQELAADGSVK